MQSPSHPSPGRRTHYGKAEIANGRQIPAGEVTAADLFAFLFCLALFGIFCAALASVAS